MITELLHHPLHFAPVAGVTVGAAPAAVAGLVASGSSSAFVTVLAAVSPIIAAAVGVYLSKKVKEVHTLVNSQMTAALDRVAALEGKLGLTAGEAIPGAAIVAPPTTPEVPDGN